MQIPRRFTKAGQDVYSTVEWTTRTSRITNADGSVVFEMKDAEIPRQWSQLATDIMVSKYFRKAGVPQFNDDGTRKMDAEGKPVTGPERSVRQVVHRLAGCWRAWGEKHGYFDSPEDGQAFHDELAYMMLHQMTAPNSPQWFNTGLHWAYGISGPAQGHWIVDPETGMPQLATDAYSHPQPHACFIQSISDDLVNDGGIMDLWTREARLFKYGSGTGTNFSPLRGENENLSGGGKSSGLMSWLRIGDRAAGAIKSGGTTRRAAKMVCLDADHPDIEQFVTWKAREELKVAAMVEGMKHLPDEQRKVAEKLNLKLDYDFNGEAYQTVSGQNANNSIRLTNEFFTAVEENRDWHLKARTTGKIVKTIKARDLWDQVCFAAWRSADPGVQYDTTINQWHTCPSSGRINASNPCVTGDTLIATTRGYRRIEDLVDQTVEIISGDGEPARVDRVFRTGRKPVYDLTTTGGYRVRLTADHRVRTLNRGDVPASELTPADELQLETPGFGEAFVPEAFGELLGAALGGCMNEARTDVLFASNEPNVAGRLQANVNECRHWMATGEARGATTVAIAPPQHETEHGTLRGRMLRYAAIDRAAAHRTLHDTVFSLDRFSLSAILRGLFTAAGRVDDDAGQVVLRGPGLPLLQQVQLLLLSFGIKSEIDTSASVLSGSTLRVARGSGLIFEKEIGFLRESGEARTLTTMNAETGCFSEDFVERLASFEYRGEEDVYDLTEPRTSHFVANGLVVHNCSEYMFLDNTACNLASINVLTLYDAERRTFDVEAFEHAIRLWTIVLEISVLMAAFPSREIAAQSYRFRTLGLGYANLGAMLMQAGIPYDSEQGRAICGAVTSILTGRAYATSAEMAESFGPFAGYDDNREAMLRVMRNHRRAAYGVPRDSAEYESLDVRPVPIPHEHLAAGQSSVVNTDEMLRHARTAWDDAIQRGERCGYRNAQTTVIAPTGTIGLLMDCDTTGVEPDFALTKFKKLAGGGYFKIANQSLRPALKTLGYEPAEVDDIVRYVMGTLSLDTAMPDQPDPPDRPADEPGEQTEFTFRDFLVAKGYTPEDVIAVENELPMVFELRFAFTGWTMPAHVLEALGLDVEATKTNPEFNGLKALGLTALQIEALHRAICGTQTIEGAPHLKEEDLPVFDCANKCGEIGTRYISPQGHIRMMAAAQPFISGAISKTINLPAEASQYDIASAYWLSWELGLKANALYRDGSKLSQPLSTKSDTKPDTKADAASESDGDDAGNDLQGLETLLGEASTAAVEAESVTSMSSTSSDRTLAADVPEIDRDREAVRTVERVVERIVERPLRRRLPDTRQSLTHRFNVAGHEGYLTVGLYDDGNPGELFITMSKEGSTIGGLMDSLGTAISVAMQYGVPLESLVNKFAHQRFEPMGMTTNRDVPFAKSLVDYIFRWLGMEFVPGYREANAPQRNQSEGSGRTELDAEVEAEASADDDDDAVSTPVRRAGGPDRPATKPKIQQATVTEVERKTETTATRLAAPGTDAAATIVTESRIIDTVSAVAVTASLNRSNAQLQGDAPVCDVCGAITVRNGTCYKCMNCGNSMGCS